MKRTLYPEVLIFKMDTELAGKLQQRASSDERTKAWIVRKALESYLQQENKSTVSKLSGMNGALVGTN